MAEHLAALQAGDLAAFEALLQGLMSENNEHRVAAEALLTEFRKSPDACVRTLVRSLRQSQDPTARTLSAVLLRKVLTRDKPSLWPTLTPETKALVKSETLACIKEEKHSSTAHKVCDLVSQLAAGTIEEQAWPELLPFMFQCVQSGEPNLMESALLIFSQLARYVMGVLVQYLGTLHDVLHSCLAHESADVRSAAMRATCSFIQSVNSAADRDKFQDTLPPLITAIGTALAEGDDDMAAKGLESLIEVADGHPRFLRKQLAPIVDAMLAIADNESVDSSVRNLAAEFLVTLCEAREKAPGMMRRLPHFTERLFATLMRFLLDIEDSPAWYAAVDEVDRDAGEGELHEFGQECLDRVALSLGGKALLPVAAAALPGLLADQRWEARVAALVCLAQIAEGCARVMVDEMGALAQMCVAGAHDSHPRVRWAACQATGQLCTDLGPEMQEQEHARLLPALIHLMDDQANPRVVAHACNAAVNFCTGTDQDVVAPYLDTLVPKLVSLLNGSRSDVQEAALTALASLADCAQEYFVRYYDTAMPLLRSALEHARTPEQALLRAKALECASLVGMSVGGERFAPDAHFIMELLRRINAEGLSASDPLHGYIPQAGARICRTLGDAFVPYLEVVIPPLLATIEKEPEIDVADVGSDDEVPEGLDDDNITFYVGDRCVSLRTAELEEKATAVSMLVCYADELDKGFFPYVQRAALAVTPLLPFAFHEEVRSSAAACLPMLVRSAVSAAEAGGPGAPNEAYVRELFAYSWKDLMAALLREADPEVEVAQMEAAAEMLDIEAERSLLPAEQAVKPLAECLKRVLDAYESRRTSRLSRKDGEDFDEDEAAALEEEHEREGDLLDSAGTAAGALLRAYKDAALPGLEVLMRQVGVLLQPDRFPEERRIALCIMDDVIEHSPQGTAMYGAQVMPMLVEGLADANAGVRQCCAYGVGVACEHRPEIFAPHAQAALHGLVNMIRAPNARTDENLAATENAAGALVKMMERTPQLTADPALGTLLVDSLPIVEDREEAKTVHAALIRFIRNSDPRILGEGNANLPKLVQILVRVLAKGNKLINIDAAADGVVLLKQMKAALPDEVFQGFVSALKPKQQATLRELLEAA